MVDIFKKNRKEVVLGDYKDAWMLVTYRLASKNNLEHAGNRLLKRSFDMIIATILLALIFSWLFPLVALLIKIDSKGPVFFVQKRTGLRRKSFHCIKFRTMFVNKEAHRQRVVVGDKRITRVGFFLRKYFIDEIPQLINVLRGEMSMVGPRPFMLWDNVRDAKLIEYYHERHRVKPGLTGLAQIRGYHGYVKNQKELFNRFSSDIEYIDNWSFLGDFIILFGTAIHIIKGI